MSDSPTISNLPTLLADYQSNSDWVHAQLVKELHRWAEIFNEAFDLRLPVVVIGISWMRRKAYGTYRYGRNDFGLEHEILLNEKYLKIRPACELLRTLLHEMLHAEQGLYGRPGKHGYHNRAFSTRAAEFGLIVDTRGCTSWGRLSPNPTISLLEKHGIAMKLSDEKQRMQKAAERTHSSKLKRWECGCGQSGRFALADVEVTCKRCKTDFVLVTH